VPHRRKALTGPRGPCWAAFGPLLVDKLIVGVLHLSGGGLQLWAAFAASRRHGPLETLQARQLESALGRRGTVVFLVVAGLVLATGAWLVSVGLASTL